MLLAAAEAAGGAAAAAGVAVADGTGVAEVAAAAHTASTATVDVASCKTQLKIAISALFSHPPIGL